jgi:hypothetical protein
MSFVRKLSTVVGAAALACLVAAPAAAAETDAESDIDKRTAARYCVVYLDQPGDEACYSSPSAVEAAMSWRSGASAALAQSIIATHYDLTGWSGSSVNIVGASCTGGVWWPTGWWDNRISSTRNYCGGGPITHYDSSSCSGTNSSSTASTSNLGWMSDRTSCVRYG